MVGVLCRPLTADDTDTKKVQFIGFDITGGKIEYDILASQGPNTTLRRVSPPCHAIALLDVCPEEPPHVLAVPLTIYKACNDQIS